MLRWLSRNLIALGVWVGKRDYRVRWYLHTGDVTVFSYGSTVRSDAMRVALGEKLHYAPVLVEGPGFIRLFDSEPDARAFLTGYFSVTSDGLRVTQFVNGEAAHDMRFNGETFTAGIPLFPLEASAA